ncbi:Uncharacterised protein [uncultured archaeon]|nr:Uncharacterised protein [uncultured archaeon]
MKHFNFLLSITLIISGIALVGSTTLSKITGNVVNNGLVVGFSFSGFLFLISGIVLFLVTNEGEGKPKKNLAQIVKESGKTIDNSRDLIHLARECGYTLGQNVREGTPVYDSAGTYITVIPIHKVTWRISKNIVRDLASGKPSFRRDY